MSAIWKVLPSYVNQLSPEQLTSILIHLLHLEAARFNIFRSNISGSSEITVADGGEDARVSWEYGTERTDWFPKRFCMFQSKATTLLPGQCIGEITISKSLPIKLKTQIEELFDKSGAYILFTTQILNEKMIKARVDKFREGIRLSGKEYSESACIMVYDANKIAQWINEYIPCIIEVSGYVKRDIPAGAKTWTEWSRYSEFQIAYEIDDAISENIKNIRAHLSNENKTTRIVGSSGLGKSRLLLEALRPPGLPSDNYTLYSISSLVVYFGSVSLSDNFPAVLSAWVREGLHGIIVLDDCPVETHQLCAREVERVDSKISLVTIDYDVDNEIECGLTIKVGRSSDQVVSRILLRAYPKLNERDLTRIVSFAQGYPQIAVMLASARLRQKQANAVLTDDILIRKMLWGRQSPNTISYEALSACSIFEHIGFFGRKEDERRYIALNICNISTDVFFSSIQKFINRGIVERRGDYIFVSPLPLALHMASIWWRNTSPERAIPLLSSEMPHGMKNALYRQLSKMNFLEVVKDIVATLCAEGALFSKKEVLLSEEGSRLFSAIVEVNPIATSQVLSKIIHGIDIDEMKRVGPARRSLVWSLEKLCFWEDTFMESASSLLLFALSENENIGNNATNQLLNLFHVKLSGTQANFKMRLSIIDRTLSHADDQYIALAIRMLTSALETNHFSIMSGVESQGSRIGGEEWSPKRGQEIIEYWSASLDRLTLIGSDSPEYYSVISKNFIPHIEGLVKHGMIDNIAPLITGITSVHSDQWTEVFEKLENILGIRKEAYNDDTLQKVKNYISVSSPNPFREN
jgi:hypothetical protein